MEHTDIQDVIWFGVAATPIIVAVVEFAKRVFIPAGLTSRLAPVVAVTVGLLGGWVFHLSGEDQHTIYQALTGGFLAGLSASGLYSGVKAVTHE